MGRTATYSYSGSVSTTQSSGGISRTMSNANTNPTASVLIRAYNIARAGSSSFTIGSTYRLTWTGDYESWDTSGAWIGSSVYLDGSSYASAGSTTYLTNKPTSLDKTTTISFQDVYDDYDGECSMYSSISYHGFGSSNYGSNISNYPITLTVTRTTSYTYTMYLAYNANGGSGAPSRQSYSGSSSSYSFTVSSTVPTRSGHTFLGWSTSSTATSATYTAGDRISVSWSKDTVTLYAVWRQNSYTCYLYYGGTGAPSTQSYTGTSTSNHTFTISSTVPTRDGYSFMGWSTSSAATTATYQPGGTISVGYNSSVRLYAVWQQSYTHTIQYDANGGDGAPASESVTNTSPSYSMAISSDVPTRDGYVFLGWSTSSESTEAEYSPGDVISVGNETVILYAIWQRDEISGVWIKASEEWHHTDRMYIKMSGAWMETGRVYIKADGTWNTSFTGTLTGTLQCPVSYANWVSDFTTGGEYDPGYMGYLWYDYGEDSNESLMIGDVTVTNLYTYLGRRGGPFNDDGFKLTSLTLNQSAFIFTGSGSGTISFPVYVVGTNGVLTTEGSIAEMSPISVIVTIESGNIQNIEVDPDSLERINVYCTESARADSFRVGYRILETD